VPREWKPREAKKYFEWFLIRIPDRLAELRRLVDVSQPGLGKRVDSSPESLGPLGEWFCTAMVWRRMNDDEIRRETAGMSKRSRDLGMPIEDLTLTTESLSICVDAGIYQGEIYRARFRGVHWALCTKPKRHVSYHQPLLEGVQPVPVDPILATVTDGYKVARGTGGPDMFTDAYRWLVGRNGAA
jgi:hypothetical protein